jgi:hypothetical protein
MLLIIHAQWAIHNAQCVNAQCSMLKKRRATPKQLDQLGIEH